MDLLVKLDSLAIAGALVAIFLRYRQDHHGSLMAALLSSVCSIAAWIRRRAGIEKPGE
jgi:hypothetical protein